MESTTALVLVVAVLAVLLLAGLFWYFQPVAAPPQVLQEPQPDATDKKKDKKKKKHDKNKNTEPSWTLERNVDYMNPDNIRTYTGTTAAVCKAACKALPNCAGFVGRTVTDASTASDIDACWLKSKLDPASIQGAWNRITYRKP